MISVRIQGRLGNQLFQYAFALSSARSLGTSFFLDQTIERCILPKYFFANQHVFHSLDRYLFSIKGFKNLFNFHLRKLFYSSAQFALTTQKITYNLNTTKRDITLKNNTFYEGFFQSESFFEKERTLIKKAFQIKPRYKRAYNSKFKSLFSNKKVITLHIRRTDYQNLEHMALGGKDLTIPATYYHQLISDLYEPECIFVFIGDDLSYIKQEFNYVENKYISEEPEIIDLQLLINSDVCVISNSTFSWWGAWLNDKPQKMVYVPQYFLGFRIGQEFPPEIYPQGWLRVDLN